MLFGSVFLLLTTAAIADPQSGNFGSSYRPPKFPSVFGNSEIAEIYDLYQLTKTTLRSMAFALIDDNSQVGARIAETLEGEIQRAVQIVSDFTSNVVRRKRQAPGTGEKLSGVLAGSMVMIGKDIKGTSPKTQDRVDKIYTKGLEQCKTDTCKTTLDAKKKVDAAKDQEV